MVPPEKYVPIPCPRRVPGYLEEGEFLMPACQKYKCSPVRTRRTAIGIFEGAPRMAEVICEAKGRVTCMETLMRRPSTNRANDSSLGCYRFRSAPGSTASPRNLWVTDGNKTKQGGLRCNIGQTDVAPLVLFSKSGSVASVPAFVNILICCRYAKDFRFCVHPSTVTHRVRHC